MLEPDIHPGPSLGTRKGFTEQGERTDALTQDHALGPRVWGRVKVWVGLRAKEIRRRADEASCPWSEHGPRPGHPCGGGWGEGVGVVISGGEMGWSSVCRYWRVEGSEGDAAVGFQRRLRDRHGRSDGRLEGHELRGTEGRGKVGPVRLKGGTVAIHPQGEGNGATCSG